MMMQLMHRDFLEQKDGLLEQEIQPPPKPPLPRCPLPLCPAPCPAAAPPPPPPAAPPPCPPFGGGGGVVGQQWARVEALQPTPASHHTLI